MKKEESKSVRNCSKTLMILMIVCVVLSIATLSIVIFDRFINKEELDHVVLNPVSCPLNEVKEKDSGFNYINELKEVNINEENQTIKVGSREYKVKTGSQDTQDYVLFINDKAVSQNNNFIHADKVYVTDKYALFASTGQNGQTMVYAIDSEGKEITINQSNQYQMHDFKVVSGILHAMGDEFCFDDCGPLHDIMILYIGNSIIVTFAD